MGPTVQSLRQQQQQGGKVRSRLDDVRRWEGMSDRFPGLSALCLSPGGTMRAASATGRLAELFEALARFAAARHGQALRRLSTPLGLRMARRDAARARIDLERAQREEQREKCKRLPPPQPQRPMPAVEQGSSGGRGVIVAHTPGCARPPPPPSVPTLASALLPEERDQPLRLLPLLVQGLDPGRPGRRKGRLLRSLLAAAGQRAAAHGPVLDWAYMGAGFSALLRSGDGAVGRGLAAVAGTADFTPTLTGLAEWAAEEPSEVAGLEGLQALFTCIGGPPLRVMPCGAAYFGAARAAQRYYQKLLEAEREDAEVAEYMRKREAEISPSAASPPSRVLFARFGRSRSPEPRSPVRQRRPLLYPGLEALLQVGSERGVPRGVLALDRAAEKQVVYMPPFVPLQQPRHLLPEADQAAALTGSSQERPMTRLLLTAAAGRPRGQLPFLDRLEDTAGATGLRAPRPDACAAARSVHSRARHHLLALETEQAAAEARRCFGGGFGDLWADPLPDYSDHFAPAELVGVRAQVAAELHAVRWAIFDPRASAGPSSHSPGSPQGAAGGLSDSEKEHAAQEAKEADESCSDQTLVRGVRYAILARTAYRVPTGAEFYERLRKLRAAGSCTSGREQLRKYRREAEAQLAIVRDNLDRLWVASGRRFRLCAQTTLQLPGEAGDGASMSGTQGSSGGEDIEDTPQVPPGWFISQDKDAPQEVCVCVAGTQNADDVFRDVLFVPVPFEVPDPGGGPPVSPWPGAKVHKGFLDGALKLLGTILPELQQLRPKPDGALNLHFTGHSLGGATAMLLASFIACMQPEGLAVASLYTYGAPNVFHIDDWQAMGKPVPPFLRGVDWQQYVNHRDIVPRALGSPVVVKLAKFAIRLGHRAFACITPENAECLPSYRFVGPTLHLLEPPHAATAITLREKQEAALALAAGDMRPQGGIDHKQSNYIRRLLARLDDVTRHTHLFELRADSGPEGGPAHPLLDAVLASDGCSLSPSFEAFSEDVFRRFGKVTGGLSACALLNLFWWSARNYPSYLVDEQLLDGRYELVPRAYPPELSLKGWQQLLEAGIYGDINWVGRLITATGWEQSSDRLRQLSDSDPARMRARKDLLDPPPRAARARLLQKGGNALAPGGREAFEWLFAQCALPLQAEVLQHPLMKGFGGRHGRCHGDSAMRPSAFISLVRSLELAATPLVDPAAVAAAALGAELGAQNLLAGMRELAEAARQQAAEKGIETAAQGELMDGFGNLLLPGFLTAMGAWCAEDEHRAWAALLGIGFGHDLEKPDAGGDWSWQAAAQDAHRAADASMTEELARREELLQRAVRCRLAAMLPMRAHSERRARPIHSGGYGTAGNLPVDLGPSSPIHSRPQRQ
eukprot:TRINITY_DN22365_c0_g1_i1.p1 TRINITY_DN22365_c0_g1~~TRINITY_DN22365_c0_g1_i1.p1  ORF type:complete len:1394 (+),score=424.65 TRINITY_DN22365_c0_g1_i1:83-4183(+)